MKKHLLFGLFWIVFCGKVLAQSSPSHSIDSSGFIRNSIYLEAGGNALTGSLNYELQYKWPAAGQAVALRVGGGYWPYGKSDYGSRSFNEYDLLLPLETTIIYGKRNLKVESGFGLTLIYSFEVDYDPDIQDYKRIISNSVLPTFRIGGRWQPLDKPYFLRAGIVILVPGENDLFPILPYGGLSFGYSFGKEK